MDLSIVIPVFNNEHTIEQLVLEIITSTSDWTDQIEIILVNDASTDGSLNLIKRLEIAHDQIIVINNKSNIGQQKSLYQGMKIARGKKIAMMDADLQDSPKHLKILYKNTLEHSACFIKRKGYYQSLGKMTTSFILKYILYLMTRLNIRAGSYLMMDGNIKEKIFKKNPTVIYLTVIAACYADKITYVEAFREKRYFGKSAYNFPKRVRAGLTAIYCAIQCRFYQY